VSLTSFFSPFVQNPYLTSAFDPPLHHQAQHITHPLTHSSFLPSLNIHIHAHTELFTSLNQPTQPCASHLSSSWASASPLPLLIR
jgi:hypothetical protein